MKQIVCTLLIVICKIDRKFTYILHYNIHKKLKFKKLYETKTQCSYGRLRCLWHIKNVLVFYTIIYTGDKKTKNLMKLKSNVFMEHLQICGVLWCVEAQTKNL
jgi:hypothetical protein